VEKGKTASIPFKNQIIQIVKQDDIQTVQSPNPMSTKHIAHATIVAKEIAEETDHYVKSKLLDPKTKILAVGSLFNYGIRPLTNGEPCTQIVLEKAIAKMSNKIDADLPGGSLAEVAVTNPLLVLGFMKELGMEIVEIVSVNNTDGALTFPPYWE
jgi:exopolyphosphatase / guanosine-5'-triphosphate,3'-diphosphate pyrophosphatase